MEIDNTVTWTYYRNGDHIRITLTNSDGSGGGWSPSVDDAAAFYLAGYRDTRPQPRTLWQRLIRTLSDRLDDHA